MGQWDSNLHHRQENNDGYGSRGRKPIPRTRIFVMLVVVLVGLVLTFASPLPGLGAFVVVGGVAGLGMTVAAAWLAR